MIQYRFCDFSQNLTALVLEDLPDNRVLIVSPTENYKRFLQKRFQQKTTFNPVHVVTMEELKEKIFFSEKPLLKEEKRTLAFYASMEQEDKGFFNVNNYFQAIELAQNFFNLWEEFFEERVDENFLVKPLWQSEIYPWQARTYERLVKIKQQYKASIEQRGYTDKIFLYSQSPDLKPLGIYDTVVMVNQFYYTRLEKRIIDEFSVRGKTVRIYYQLPEYLVDKNSLKIKDFTLADLNCRQFPDIEIFEAANDFIMTTALLKEIASRSPLQVVDVDYNNPFKPFLSAQKFSQSSFSFVQTSVYQFFHTLHALIKSLLWESLRRRYLCPVDTLLQALFNDIFCFYFLRRFSRDPSALRDKLLAHIYHLVDNDVKYTDFHLENIREDQVKEPLYAILDVVKRFSQLESMSDLVDLINAENGVDLQKIFTHEERSGSDLVERFYQLLFDFQTVEQLNIIESWQHYFSSPPGANPHLGLSQGILRLFLDYMKAKQIKYNYKTDTSRMHFTTLFDTRNIDYQSLAILNLSEGKIPSTRQIPYLFTEIQRKRLGLKTYEDIKLWEKYYFFRLIFTAKKVFLFSQKNIDENIQPSSFLEEIKLCLKVDDSQIIPLRDEGYRNIYQQFFKNKSHNISVPAGDFFRIQVEPENDFRDHSLGMTSYSLKDLQNNPFVFYLRHIAGIEERQKEIEYDFSPKLIGNIAHDILNRCWVYIQDTDGVALDFNQIGDELIERAAADILQHHSYYYYKIPHNHAQLYFNKIIMPVILYGIKAFFGLLADLGLSRKAIRIYAETDRGSSEEKTFQKYIARKESRLDIDVFIRGRADLRIEDESRNDRYIFDYKTGGYEKSQLLFYELYYYIIRQPELLENVFSYFYFILKQDAKSFEQLYRSGTNKQTLFLEFKSALIDTLHKISEEGFSLPQQKSFLVDFAEITRKDLFLARKEESGKSD
ncbi:hypothetical protein GF407_16945 [candidate division KSB1 bacterium]|nr:hypothetical protein [candidate division KSB1 bacterium]